MPNPATNPSRVKADNPQQEPFNHRRRQGKRPSTSSSGGDQAVAYLQQAAESAERRKPGVQVAGEPSDLSGGSSQREALQVSRESTSQPRLFGGMSFF